MVARATFQGRWGITSMSEITRIAPMTPTRPVQQARKPGREPKKRPADRDAKRSADEDDEEKSSDDSGDDSSESDGRINIRV